MRKVIILAVAMLVTVGLGLACAGDKEEGQTKSSDQTKASETQAKQPESLADKRFPIRNKDNAIVTLETNHGNMIAELYRDVAPAHADSFLARCNDGFYSGTLFHRVVEHFMIQGGNPVPVGKKPVDYYLPNEINDLEHDFGALSMASRGDPTTAQTQFFVCLDRNRSTQSLDGRYVVFGHLLSGFDVLREIGSVPVQKNKWQGGEMSGPVEDVILEKAYQSDAEGEPIE